MSTDSYTDWKQRQRAADDARHAETAQSFTDFGAFLAADKDGPLPALSKIQACIAAPCVGDEAGCAAVDAWAAKHHAEASWEGGVYQASVPMGTFRFVVFYMPERVFLERVPPVEAEEDADEPQAVAA